MMENNQSEGNELQQRAKPALNSLNDRERRIIEMRYLGKTHGEIAQEVGYHEKSVAKLFMSGGRLEKAYDEFAAVQRGKSQENVDLALSKAKAEAVNAIDRIISLSQNAQTEGGIFKANEFLLQIAGVTESVALRNYFMSKTFEQSQKIVDDLFRSIYGRGVGVTVQMNDIIKDGKILKYTIGDQPQIADETTSETEQIK